jgi:hypothetical protein
MEVKGGFFRGPTAILAGPCDYDTPSEVAGLPAEIQ